MLQRISDDEYFAADALSASGIKQMLKSPAHYKAVCIDKLFNKTTPAMEFGKVVHAVVLEPHLARKLEVIPDISGRGKTEKLEEWRASIPRDALVVSQDNYDTLMGMVASIQRHPVAAGLLRDGSAEMTGFFTVDGARCKFKADYITKHVDKVIDLKTCADASPLEFAKSIANFGYHIQAYHYLRGMDEVCGKFDREFVFVAIEKDPPYAVACYRADERMLQLAATKWAHGVNRYIGCRERNEWPGYADEITDISLPGWAK